MHCSSVRWRCTERIGGAAKFKIVKPPADCALKILQKILACLAPKYDSAQASPDTLCVTMSQLMYPVYSGYKQHRLTLAGSTLGPLLEETSQRWLRVITYAAAEAGLLVN